MDLAILCRTARHLMATPTQSIKWIIKMALSKIGFVTRVFYFKFGLKSLLCLFIVFHVFLFHGFTENSRSLLKNS